MIINFIPKMQEQISYIPYPQASPTFQCDNTANVEILVAHLIWRFGD